MKIFTLFVNLVFITAASFIREGKERFIEESIINPIEIDIPLYYSTKGSEALMAATKKIWIHRNRISF